jgi:hypothetical protein
MRLHFLTLPAEEHRLYIEQAAVDGVCSSPQDARIDLPLRIQEMAPRFDGFLRSCKISPRPCRRPGALMAVPRTPG